MMPDPKLSSMVGLPDDVAKRNARILKESSSGPRYPESTFRDKDVEKLRKKYKK